MSELNQDQFALIPMRWLGPVHIQSRYINEAVLIPLATFESPLWPSTARGVRVCNLSGGIKATLIDERMTRSILIEADETAVLHELQQAITASRWDELTALVAASSRFAKLINCHAELVGSLLFLRLEFLTGDASGHNMTSVAAERILNWILENYTQVRYVSISGNLCTDKKVSAVNGILGRGKNVVAEVIIPRALCLKHLRSLPESIVNLNIKKNLLGSILAGSLRSANAHVANILLAFYLATGQDAANIVEGSQAIVFTETRPNAQGEMDLYFSLTLPNLIVGTVGNGKGLPFVLENLEKLGCLDARTPGDNARRLSMIIAAAALCGELSLLAAQSNRGELVRSHVLLERSKRTTKEK